MVTAEEFMAKQKDLLNDLREPMQSVSKRFRIYLMRFQGFRAKFLEDAIKTGVPINIGKLPNGALL